MKTLGLGIPELIIALIVFAIVMGIPIVIAVIVASIGARKANVAIDGYRAPSQEGATGEQDAASQHVPDGRIVYCQRCGAPNDAGDSFCGRCGGKLQGDPGEDAAMENPPTETVDGL